MKRLFKTAFGLFFILITAQSSSAQDNTALWVQINSFSEAIAQNDVLRAADLAAHLSNTDFTKYGFTHYESGEFRASFAEALLDAGRVEHGMALLNAITVGDKAALEIAKSPPEKSFYRDVVVQRLERQYDVAHSRGNGNAQIDILSQIHTLKLDQIGVGHPEMDLITNSLASHLRARADWNMASGRGEAGVNDLKTLRILILNSRLTPDPEVDIIERSISDMSKNYALQLELRNDVDGAISWLEQESNHWSRQTGYRGPISYQADLVRLYRKRASAFKSYGHFEASISDLKAAERLSVDPEVKRELATVLLEAAKQDQKNGFHENAYDKSTEAQRLYFEDPFLRTEIDAVRERAFRAWKNVPDDQPVDYPPKPAYGYSAPVHAQEASTQMVSVFRPDFREVRVFFGTNRDRRRNKYSRHMSPTLEYGWAKVTVPEDRNPGDIPRPFPGFRAKDSQHIILKNSTPYSGVSEFGQKLKSSLLCAELFFFEEAREPECIAESSKKSELFIFIHGHNVAFDSAAMRTAQLAVDLDIEHGAVFFAWPTGRHALDYGTSKKNADASYMQLVSFLETVVGESGADQIHLIAHSMGNRILLNALKEVHAKRGPNGKRPFDQIIFGSPDVDESIFAASVKEIESLSNGMTLYASNKDKALQLSANLPGHEKRAGLSPPSARIINATTKLKFIDTSGLKRKFKDLIDHADFTAGAFNDVRGVLWTGAPPEERCALQEQRLTRQQVYWKAQTQGASCQMQSYGSSIVAHRNKIERPIIRRLSDDLLPMRPIRPHVITRQDR